MVERDIVMGLMVALVEVVAMEVLVELLLKHHIVEQVLVLLVVQTLHPL